MKTFRMTLRLRKLVSSYFVLLELSEPNYITVVIILVYKTGYSIMRRNGFTPISNSCRKQYSIKGQWKNVWKNSHTYCWEGPGPLSLFFLVSERMDCFLSPVLFLQMCATDLTSWADNQTPSACFQWVDQCITTNPPPSMELFRI